MWDQNSLNYGVQSQAFCDIVSIALRLAPTRDDSFTRLEFLTLITLSCHPKLSPAGQQTAKLDGLYPYTLCLINRASLCWALSAARRSLSRWFLCLTLSLLSSDSISESYTQCLSNVASLAKNMEILHHAQIRQNAYTEYARTGDYGHWMAIDTESVATKPQTDYWHWL